jgi:hypothetical protein
MRWFPLDITLLQYLNYFFISSLVVTAAGTVAVMDVVVVAPVGYYTLY